MKAKFSYFLAPIRSVTPYKDIGLDDLVKVIRGAHFKEQTDRLRATNNPDEKSHIKQNDLDFVTFAGTFDKRSKNGLKEYSGLIVLDFDDLENIKEAKAALLSQSKVDTVLLFISPSGNGLKWIVPADKAENHEQVFKMYQRFLKREFNFDVDESGKDIPRTCFIPHDPNVFYNSDYQFKMLSEYWNDPPQQQKELQPPQRKERKTKRFSGVSPFDDYNSRNDVLSLLESHGWRIESKETESIRLTRPGKKSGVSADFRLADNLFHVFTNSTEFEANKTYNPSKVFSLLECGGDDKEARRRLISLGYGDTKVSFSAKDETLERDKEKKDLNFYSDDYKISAPRLAEFFKRSGFIRIDEPGNDDLIIIKNENKILSPYNKRSNIISFLKNQIRHPEKRNEIEALLVKEKNKIQDSFLLMDGEPYKFNRDTKDTIYFPFRNGVAKITKDGVSLIDYKDREVSFFVEVESLKHDFEVFDVNEPRDMGQFEQFLVFAIIGRTTTGTDLTVNEERDIKAFFSMIGYLLSNYKDPAESPAIILSDDGADGEKRDGGRGKTILTEAISKVKKQMFRGGNEFDTTYRHNFGDLQPYNDIYILDDVPAGFNFDALYTMITGDIKAERKGTTAVTIPFEDAPKFVITTNWAVRYDKEATSTNRRFIEYKFSDFWNISNTPQKYFKNRFFSDWNRIEWQRFFEFLVRCSVYYLRFGLQRIEYSKEADNFRAYFQNDVTLQEFERIFNKLELQDSFTVTDFLDEYNAGNQRNEKIFHRNNVRTYVDTYINYHKKNITYGKRTRKWIVNEITNDSEGGCNEVVTETMPF